MNGPVLNSLEIIDLAFTVDSLEELRGAFGEGVLPQVLGRATCWHTIVVLVGEIHRGAARVASIVNALKSYTYLDRASVQSVDLHDGLEDTLVVLGGRLGAGVTVRREYDRGLPRIMARGRALNQVWTNLIENAVSAMGGSGELVVRSGRDGDAAVVQIIDSGPGIPADLIDRVFDPFVTTQPVGQGTGLGLHLARNIVCEQHGGVIRVESVPGRTCFEVRLPLGEQAAAG